MWYIAGAIIIVAGLALGIKMAKWHRNHALVRRQEAQKLARIQAMEEKLGNGKKIEQRHAVTSLAPSKSASSGICK
jgi:hypothetical protein